MENNHVTVVDVDIKFWTLTWLMVKWVFALIPAAILVVAFVAIIALCLGVGAGMLHSLLK